MVFDLLRKQNFHSDSYEYSTAFSVITRHKDIDLKNDSRKDAGGEPPNIQILHCIKRINIDLILNLWVL